MHADVRIWLRNADKILANTSSPHWIVRYLRANFMALQLISVIHPSTQPSEHVPLINIKRV